MKSGKQLQENREESMGYDNSDKKMSEPSADHNSETNTLWRKHVGFSPQSAADAYELCGKLEGERNVWKHEAETLRSELKKADEALEASIVTFIELGEERDQARACAVELRESLCRPEWSKEIVFPWEQADPGLDSENAEPIRSHP